MPKSKPITVVDVARAAGVAVGTVSRVLNHHPNVNEAARAQVLKAAQDLGYKRIRHHRREGDTAPASAARGNIGVLIFGMEDTLVHLPVVSAALHGVERALSTRGENLMLANIPRGDLVPAFLRDGGVAGLILKGPNQGMLPSAEASGLIHAIERYPHVWLMGRLRNARGDHCNFDAFAAGQLVATYLYEQNHRRIAFLNPKPGHTQFEKLQRGFVDAAEQLGAEPAVLSVPPPEELVWPLPAITHEDKVRLLVERWRRLPAATRPTALFTPSDRTAVQLYGALREQGVRVPQDVSVISCNNETSLVSGLNPPLTTVDVHAETVGRRAVEQLFWRIAHPEEPLTQQVLVEPRLVVRDSVKRLP
ncbi:MAG: LacI family DNA-binding transcriptional regulator [Verrucomicrobia bacterium]|nr:LacI family DNA-binding transcriptional regulator [Verrucomicrobiota bacterium]